MGAVTQLKILFLAFLSAQIQGTGNPNIGSLKCLKDECNIQSHRKTSLPPPVSAPSAPPPTAGAGNRRGLGGNAGGGSHPPPQPQGPGTESRGDEWRPEELGGEHSSASGPVKSNSCRSRGSNLSSVTSSEHLAQPRCARSSR